MTGWNATKEMGPMKTMKAAATAMKGQTATKAMVPMKAMKAATAMKDGSDESDEADEGDDFIAQGHAQYHDDAFRCLEHQVGQASGGGEDGGEWDQIVQHAEDGTHVVGAGSDGC